MYKQMSTVATFISLYDKHNFKMINQLWRVFSPMNSKTEHPTFYISPNLRMSWHMATPPK